MPVNIHGDALRHFTVFSEQFATNRLFHGFGNVIFKLIGYVNKFVSFSLSLHANKGNIYV